MPIPNTFASQTGPIPLSELDANFAYLINETEVTLPAQIAGLSLTNFGKNMVINGDCSISQVNSNALITPLGGTFSIDMFLYGAIQASKLQSQQVFTSLNSLGATSALQWSVLSSYSPASTDYFFTFIGIEGYNFARCQFGTANAKPVSLQFKVNASVSGTYSGAIVNYAGTRSYPFQFTVPAGVDTLIQIPNIAGDTGGTWVGATNAGAAYVKFDLGSGTNFKSTAGTWQAGNYTGATGSTNLVAQTNGSTLTITDVQLEQSANCTGFERKYFEQNLTECQRYWEKSYDYGTAVGTVTNAGSFIQYILGSSNFTSGYINIPFKVSKRVAPTMLAYSPATGASGKAYDVQNAVDVNGIISIIGTNNTGVTANITANTTYYVRTHFTADARI